MRNYKSITNYSNHPHMNYNKLTVSIALVLLVCFKLEAQEMPKILPPSPQSEQFFKQFEFPANNPNGTINYNLPIYEVKSGSLSLPISLSYVSGGTKMADVPGEIGLNWSLNAGGRISRTIYGKPDYNMSDSVPTANNNDGSFTNTEIYNYVAQVYDPGHAWDSEFDIYSYSFGNTSGKFIYQQQFNSSNQNEFKLIPEKPYKIDGPMTSNTWTIVDDKGITYSYETYEQFNTTGSVNFGAVTARHLNSIISADKKDTITIDYQTMIQSRNSQTAMSLVKDNNTVADVNLGSPGNYNYTGLNYINETYNSNYNTYITMVPKNIYFKGGKMTFSFGIGGVIEYIKIYDKKNNLVKQFQLVGGGSISNLTELRCQDINAATVEKYSFEYYPFPTSNIYQADYLGYIKSNGMHVFNEHIDAGFYYRLWDDVWHVWKPEPYYDGWGYNKGTYAPDGYASDETSIIGMLKKVTYPSGGSAEYTYEGNLSSNGTTGGMRLAQAKLTDNNGNVHYKTYKYGITGEEGYGPWKDFYISNTYGPSREYTAYETRVFPSWEYVYFNPAITAGQSYRKRVYTSSYLPEIAEAAQEPQVYPTVTVYEGTPSNNTGKTVYKYNYTGPKYQLGYYPLADWSNFGVNAGYHGDYGMEFDPALSYRYHITEFHPWKSYPLESTTIYKNNGSGYDVVKSTVNTYNIVETQRFKGLHVLKNVEIEDYYATNAVTLQIPIFLYDNYYITNGREDLQSTTETLYTSSGNIVNTTQYEYNSNNLVSKVTRSESKGGTKITTYAYPTDFASTQPYSKMVENNMVSSVIEESNYKNSVLTTNHLQSNKTEYSFWSNGQTTTTPNNSIYPKTVLSKTGASNYEERLQFHSYDGEGNITSVSKVNDVVKSYIWGYNHSYPVAELVGVPYDDAMGLLDQGIIQNPSSDADLRTELNKITTTYPSAQVSTYTYKPLIGVSSQTDINGRTTYYNYDAFGRLSYVKDKDGNVVKRICYNYLGQPGDCSLYGNAVKSQDFTKQDCPEGTTGSTVTYSVAQNKYYGSSQTEADALAQAEIDANGQAYANANGSCISANTNVYCYSSLWATAYTVYFYNLSTENVYSVVVYPGNSTSITIPNGNYSVSFLVYYGSNDYNYFNANGYSTYGYEPYIYNVPFSGYGSVQIGY
jgi:YD repeat-containing protein